MKDLQRRAGHLQLLDVLPALKDRDSSSAAHAALQWVPASAPTATACGLTPVPQAFSLSARPAARIFFAAFTSRGGQTIRALWGAGLRWASGGETGEVGHQAHLVVEVLPAGLDDALETAEDLEADQAVQVGPGGEDPFE